MSGWESLNSSYAWSTPSNEYNPSFPSLSAYNPTSSVAPFTQNYFPSKSGSKQEKNRAKNPISVKEKTGTSKKTEETTKAMPKIKKAKINSGFNRSATNQSLGWDGEWSNFQILTPQWFGGQTQSNSRVGRGGFRGGRGGSRGRPGGSRGGRGGFRRHVGPSNKKTDIEFVPLEDNVPAISLNCNPENIVAFHGFDSVFTTQHNFPVLVEGRVYNSCDHYYQCRKVLDLTGSVSEKLLSYVRDENGELISKGSTVVKNQSFSQMAKEALKEAKVEKTAIDTWRISKGLEVIQISILAKVSQSAHLREALKETTDQLLVHAFKGDSIYGTGCGVPKIKKWLEDLKNSGVRQIRIPGTFPLNDTTVKGCPILAEGRNILGIILMLLRDKIHKNDIEVVDMTKIFNALRASTDEKMEVSNL